MSCRSHILHDAGLARYLVNQSHIVNIDDDKNKLSDFEKRQILNKYTSAMNLSGKDRDKIVAIEKYFPTKGNIVLWLFLYFSTVIFALVVF